MSILYFTVSNDTYNYLLTGEKPLDEANLEEAEMLEKDLCCNGSEIVEYGVSLVELLPEGKVKIAVTPVDFHYMLDMGKYVTFEFGYHSNKTHVIYRWRNLESSLCWGLGVAPIAYNTANKPQITTNKGSVIPLQSPAIKKLL